MHCDVCTLCVAQVSDAERARLSTCPAGGERRHAKCSGPFAFAVGPLAITSAPVARWYTSSTAIQANAAAALKSRMLEAHEHVRSLGNLSRRAARSVGHKLFDDVFFGHELCMGPRAGSAATALARTASTSPHETPRGGLRRVHLISFRAAWPAGPYVRGDSNPGQHARYAYASCTRVDPCW